MNTVQRSSAEKIFLWFYFPSITLMYLVYKYPTLFMEEQNIQQNLYWLGKSPSFWYGLVYSLIICSVCIKVLVKKQNPYTVGDRQSDISSYQQKKWTSILLSQSIVFFFIPFIMPWLIGDTGFWQDTYKPVGKDAYVYVYNGFTSMSGFLYLFILVPVSVWFFGKRYCSWFCACGNLAEAVGATPWGKNWVQRYTPRGQRAVKLEMIQIMLLGFALIFGLVLFLDSWKMITAPDLVSALWGFQHLVVDLMFGALIGVGAYPILGTRIWCRYGCPLAGMMKLFGTYSKSRAIIVADDKCKGIGHCSVVCPMGIDVESFAHKSRVPLHGDYGLSKTPCISCGSCVATCPAGALKFEKIIFPKATSLESKS